MQSLSFVKRACSFLFNFGRLIQKSNLGLPGILGSISTHIILLCSILFFVDLNVTPFKLFPCLRKSFWSRLSGKNLINCLICALIRLRKFTHDGFRYQLWLVALR